MGATDTSLLIWFTFGLLLAMRFAQIQMRENAAATSICTTAGPFSGLELHVFPDIVVWALPEGSQPPRGLNLPSERNHRIIKV